MNDESILINPINAAAHFLVIARSLDRPGDRLPEALRPRDCEAAFKIQQHVSAMLGEAIVGWKAALPSDDKLVVAPIYANTLYQHSSLTLTPRATKFEPEVALILGHDLPVRLQPYRENELRDALSGVRLALEFIGGRYANAQSASFPELLADGLFNEGLFLGDTISSGLDQSLEAFPLTINGQPYDGQHPNGNPIAPALWLVNFLSAHGIGLTKNQALITGSYAGVFNIDVNSPLDIQYSNFGNITLNLNKE